jgi:inhibitor of cysteine peptidase
MLSKRFRSILLAMATFACASPGHAGSERSHEIVIDQAADGSTVALHLGQLLQVHLKGNPTAGFTWELMPDTEPILERQGEPRFTPDSGKLGAGGVYRFSFKAQAPGSTPLKFRYRRLFEKGIAAAETFEVTVVIAK